MAPKSSRRSGSSRRAQYSVFTGYVIAGIGALIGAALLGLSLARPGSFSGANGAATDAVRPVGEGASAVRSEGKNLFESIAGYYRAGSKNAALKREVELARIRLAEARAVRQENARLKALIGLSESEVRPIVTTRLVGSSAVSSRRFAYLGAGSRDGVQPGMTVRSARGVVGRVLEVSRATSRVLLLSDSQSVIPVRLADETREAVAFVEGRGSGVLSVRLINLGINPLKKGDVLVTSGSGGYFRPGVAVAIVSEVTDDGAHARMISDPAATEFVAVEPVWQPEAAASAALPPDEVMPQDGGGE